MSTEQPEIIYQRLIQRNGNRADLRTLENAEFGFANDTGQLFIGSNLTTETFADPKTIKIEPIPNVRNFVNTLLSNSTDFNEYYVTDDLLIHTESLEKSSNILNYINNYVAENYQNIQPIARLSTNVEVITELNISDYSNPAYDNVSYNVIDRFNRPSRRVLSKILSINEGDVFLTFKRTDATYIRVEYSLVQNNGQYKRSGTMEVLGDNDFNNITDISFNDNQHLINPNIDEDQIRFNAVYDGYNVKIMFEQPATDTTRIFYRITRWGIDNVMEVGKTYIEADGNTTPFGNNDNTQFGFNEDGSVVDNG